MIRAGIIGGAGYTGGELLRLLCHHPEVEIAYVHSSSQTGKAVFSVHQDLLGEIDLNFTAKVSDQIDVLFLCMGHGRSGAFLKQYTFPEKVKIIDLSNTFRIKKENHDFVYGLPELNKKAIMTSSKIANPGCFATAIQLAILPLAQMGALTDDLHIHALTGSTGAGQAPGPTTHFSWRNNNVSLYKAFQHQHLQEIRQSIRQVQSNYSGSINFLPIRGNFSRGIFASLYLSTPLELEAIKNQYRSFYADAPFVIIAESNPNLKQVVNTNRCLLYLEKHEGKLLIVSMIDNLLKGASGQAVQNMNLLFGLEEGMGLHLKAMVF